MLFCCEEEEKEEEDHTSYLKGMTVANDFPVGM